MSTTPWTVVILLKRIHLQLASPAWIQRYPVLLQIAVKYLIRSVPKVFCLLYICLYAS